MRVSWSSVFCSALGQPFSAWDNLKQKTFNHSPAYLFLTIF